MEGMPNTIIAAVIGGVFTIVAAIIGAYLHYYIRRDKKLDQAAATSASSVIPPATPSAAPTFVSANGLNEEEQRQMIRQQHNVRRMEAVENELKYSVAPRNIYGFTSSMRLYNPSGIILHRGFSHSQAFEIHKMNDGTGRLIGFVSTDVAVHIQRDNRPSEFPITIYNRKWSEAPTMAIIPTSYIKSDYSGRRIVLDSDTILRALDITLVKK